LPTNTKRLDQLRAAHDFIEQARKEEIAKVSAELTKINVDCGLSFTVIPRLVIWTRQPNFTLLYSDSKAGDKRDRAAISLAGL